MSQLQDLVGKKYGIITVQELLDEINISGSRMWLCICECGKSTKMSTSSLNDGIKSCGCIARNAFVLRNTGKPSNNLKPYGHSNAVKVFHYYKANAKAKGRVLDLSFDEFLTLTQQNCYYCNTSPKQVMKIRKANGEFIFNGIDRVDNDGPYSLANSVPCCYSCNRAKSNMSQETFLDLVRNIYFNRINTN